MGHYEAKYLQEIEDTYEGRNLFSQIRTYAYARTLHEIIKKESIEIIDYNGSDAEFLILGYYEDGKIYLNNRTIKQVQKQIGFDTSVRDCVLAHEVFHHCDRKYSLVPKLYREVGAHIFVENILKLSFDPSVLSEKLKIN